MRLFAQDSLAFAAADSNQSVVQTYLASPGSEDEKIMELISLAKMDQSKGHNLEAIHKIRIALILEQQSGKPSKATYQLNLFAAEIVRTFDPEYALEFYKKATAISDQLAEIPDKDRFVLYTNRAGMHNAVNGKADAILWFRRAIVMAEKDNPISMVSAFNNVGVFYKDENQSDSARFYFQKALVQLSDPENNISLWCAIRDNLAQLDMRDHHFEKAYPIFLYNDSVYEKSKLSGFKYLANKVRLLEAMQGLNLPGIQDTIARLKPY
ncbi:MAG TPA: hypothetical protein VJ508_05390, partial [Saprospiraceae bacterium]|nr:hypothetical protein [Saprospiraceae bacterium]